MVENPNATCKKCHKGYKITVYLECPRCYDGPESEILVPAESIDIFMAGSSTAELTETEKLPVETTEEGQEK